MTKPNFVSWSPFDHIAEEQGVTVGEIVVEKKEGCDRSGGKGKKKKANQLAPGVAENKHQGVERKRNGNGKRGVGADVDNRTECYAGEQGVGKRSFVVNGTKVKKQK